jgi:hypothetical protein
MQEGNKVVMFVLNESGNEAPIAGTYSAGLIRTGKK